MQCTYEIWYRPLHLLVHEEAGGKTASRANILLWKKTNKKQQQKKPKTHSDAR